MYIYRERDCIYRMISDVSSVSPGDDDCLGGDRRQADGGNKKKQRRNTTIMHVHVGRKKRSCGAAKRALLFTCERHIPEVFLDVVRRHALVRQRHAR